MPARTTFGQRAAPQTSMARAGTTQAATAPQPEIAPAQGGAFDALYAGGIPVVTCGLIFLLVLVFLVELRLTTDAGQSFSPNRQALIALGGINGKLTLGAQEWWRVFTAPLLHGSPSHLLGNCVALFFAGLFLEPMIGAGWFAVLFFVAALGGAAGSLVQNDAGMVSVGASGAITGLLAATLMCSQREKDPVRRRRMQFLSARILIPAVAPIFFSQSATGSVDYGAHAGGAMAGALLWLLLSASWNEKLRYPPFQGPASGAAGLGAALTVCAFLLAGFHRGAYVETAPTLIPQSQFPGSSAAAIRQSAELVNRFPTDPRAHYYRALYFYDQRNLPDAAEQLRTGLADLSAHPDEFKPQLGQSMKMTLAIVQKEEGALDAARDTAHEACATAPPSSLLDTLREEKICD